MTLCKEVSHEVYYTVRNSRYSKDGVRKGLAMLAYVPSYVKVPENLSLAAFYRLASETAAYPRLPIHVGPGKHAFTYRHINSTFPPTPEGLEMAWKHLEKEIEDGIEKLKRATTSAQRRLKHVRAEIKALKRVKG